MSWLNRRSYLLWLDVALIIISAPLGFFIRLDASPLFVQYLPIIGLFAIVGLTVKLFLYWAFGLYRHLWRYASTNELLLIVTAVTFSSLVLTVIFATVLVPYGFLWAFPRSVLIIDWLLQLVLVGGIRILAKVSAEGVKVSEAWGQKHRPRRVLIAGVDDMGAMIVRELQHNATLDAIPIGFIDDDLTKIGKRIHNVPVLGQLRDLPGLLQKWTINEVIIATPNIADQTIREVAQTLEAQNLSLKILPNLYHMLSPVKEGVGFTKDGQD